MIFPLFYFRGTNCRSFVTNSNKSVITMFPGNVVQMFSERWKWNYKRDRRPKPGFPIVSDGLPLVIWSHEVTKPSCTICFLVCLNAAQQAFVSVKGLSPFIYEQLSVVCDLHALLSCTVSCFQLFVPLASQKWTARNKIINGKSTDS